MGEIAAHILKDVHKTHEEKTAKPHKGVCGPSNCGTSQQRSTGAKHSTEAYLNTAAITSKSDADYKTIDMP